MRKKLVAARKAAGYAQIDIAREIGWSRSHYSQVEEGGKDPSLRMALAIKQAVGYYGDDLFENTPSQHRIKRIRRRDRAAAAGG